MKPMGGGCWELGSFNLRIAAKVWLVGCCGLLSAPPLGMYNQQLDSICQGWTREALLNSGRVSKHLWGLLKAQVSGLHSRWGWVGIWALNKVTAAAVKPGGQWPGGHWRVSLWVTTGGVSF